MVSAASEESRERRGRFGSGRMSRSGKIGDGVSGAEVYAPPVEDSSIVSVVPEQPSMHI